MGQSSTCWGLGASAHTESYLSTPPCLPRMVLNPFLPDPCPASAVILCFSGHRHGECWVCHVCPFGWVWGRALGACESLHPCYDFSMPKGAQDSRANKQKKDPDKLRERWWRKGKSFSFFEGAPRFHFTLGLKIM